MMYGSLGRFALEGGRSLIGPEAIVVWMVRAVGLEPTLLAERDFESRASTNFTTPAYQTPLR